MPKQYEAIRDKFVSKGMPLKEAKTHAAKIYNSTHHDNPVTGKQPKEMASGGPITAASIEASGTPRQGGDGGLTGYSTGLSNPTPASSPEIKPISTTNTPPGTGGGLSGYSPSLGGSALTTDSGLTPSKGGNWFKDGGMIMGGPVHDGIAMPPTAGVSSSYPPPPGERKQGPRNYSKKG